ncbi:acyltransferase family protein [Nocardioides sp.]|uniref:acyltransferase family protein n=1 Tax=Nocardioides sp. TaxID=35761 RepID=UPI002CAFB52E|nr:acyltransferase family protein [Nocardioides sp.]HXH79194.1 acyltransferase family protein [Nocardioides sp.]
MASPTRDPWLDNTKMVLVTLVVVGHSWALLPDTHFSNWAYDFLYFWHVPAFVFISGYLSTSFEWTRRHFKGLLYVLVIPYLIFEPALYYYRIALGEDVGWVLYLQPHWTMWYLPALFCWRLMTPVLKRHWLFLPLSVVVSLAAGLWDPESFGLPRILGLLPFFVLGLHLKPRHLHRLDDPWVKVASLGTLVLIAVLSRDLDDWARTAFLLYDAGYEGIASDVAYAAQTRLSVMAIGLVGAFAVMALIPRRGGWFTAMGAATMNVYLLHGFVIKTAQLRGFPEWSAERPYVALLVTTAGSVALALALASPWSRRHLSWLVNPLGMWESRRKDRGRAAPHTAPVPTQAAPPIVEQSPAHAPRAAMVPLLPGGPDATAPTPPVAAGGAAAPAPPRAAPSDEHREPESPR